MGILVLKVNFSGISYYGFFVAMQAMLTILISPSRDTLYDY